jgi:hypothetical protein
VNADNLDEFLRGVDLYVDGLDFFAFSARPRDIRCLWPDWGCRQ